MKTVIKYLIIILFLNSACETVYNPELDPVDKVLVVDAQLTLGNSLHKVILRKSKGFNEPGNYQPVAGAQVFIQDDSGEEIIAMEQEAGEYSVHLEIIPSRRYRLLIYSEGETYTSEFEPVPEVPDLDTLYTREFVKWTQPGGETNTSEFRKEPGHQVYIDIAGNDHQKYYRFSARRVIQFYVFFDTVMFGGIVREIKYGWESFGPSGTYNIAGPSEYGSDNRIIQHPLEFFPYDESAYLDSTQKAAGWIYIIHQYGINKQAWLYYRDLVSQLNAEGKIFDPLYVQAQNNITCTTDPNKLVLGNFEVCSYREHRYLIKLNDHQDYHTIREIHDFHDIPGSGVINFYPPYFWEQ